MFSLNSGFLLLLICTQHLAFEFTSLHFLFLFVSRMILLAEFSFLFSHSIVSNCSKEFEMQVLIFTTVFTVNVWNSVRYTPPNVRIQFLWTSITTEKKSKKKYSTSAPNTTRTEEKILHVCVETPLADNDLQRKNIFNFFCFFCFAFSNETTSNTQSNKS